MVAFWSKNWSHEVKNKNLPLAKKIKFVKFSLFLHKSIVNASIWCQKTSRSVCQHFWMKSKSLVFGGFLDLSGENGSNIVNNQLTGLILLCKVFETSSQSSKCLLVLPYQWLVRHRQKKFHLSLVFAYCNKSYIKPCLRCMKVFEYLKSYITNEFLTLISGCPVLYGNKWIANKWIKYLASFKNYPCLIDNNHYSIYESTQSQKH